MLEGRVVIVTGAARGLGAGIARVCQREGARLVLVDRDEPAADMRPTQNVFDTDGPPPAAGPDVAWIRGDVADEKIVLEAEDAAAGLLDLPHWHGRAVSLVGCAAIDHRGHIATIGGDEMQHVLDVNVGGMLRFCQATVRLQRRLLAAARGAGDQRIAPGETAGPDDAFDEPARPRAARDVGPCPPDLAASIVLVSSVQATASMANATLYAATKAALTGTVLSGAVELAGEGIRINGVVPTVSGNRAVWGAICRDHGSETAALGSWGPNLPLARPTAPEEVGDAAAWLLSERASGVTGSMLRVDAGNLAQLVSTDAANTST